MKIFKTTAYSFDELSDKAKEKAVKNHHHWNVEHDWWGCAYEDAMTVGRHLGFEFNYEKYCDRRVAVVRSSPFSFSGFWSQGDGACIAHGIFDGDIDLKGLKDYAPTDSKMLEVGTRLKALCAPFSKRNLRVAIKQSGHYSHEHSMDYRYEVDEPTHHKQRAWSIKDENEFEECCRDFCRWLYKQLEKEYEHLTSDEAVGESLQSNEVLFCECGKTFDPCKTSEAALTPSVRG